MLTGPGGGDGRAARALGASESKMIGVDLNPDFVESSRVWLPKAKLICRDVEHVTRGLQDIDVMHLDFCGQIETCMPTWALCARCVTPGGVISIGVSYGRDGRTSNGRSAAADRYTHALSIAKPLLKAQGLSFVPHPQIPWIGYQGGSSTPMLYIIGRVETGPSGVHFSGSVSTSMGMWINGGSAKKDLRYEVILHLRHMSRKRVMDLYSLPEEYLRSWIAVDCPRTIPPDSERGFPIDQPHDDEAPPHDYEVVLDYIRKRGVAGAIWDEIERDTNITQWQVMSKLKKKGHIIDNGEQRRTRKAVWANVSVAIENVLAQRPPDSGCVEDFLGLSDPKEVELER